MCEVVEIFHSSARHPLCCSKRPAAPTVSRGMMVKDHEKYGLFFQNPSLTAMPFV